MKKPWSVPYFRKKGRGGEEGGEVTSPISISIREGSLSPAAAGVPPLL